MVGLKKVIYTKISPTMVNPRDIAGERRRKRREWEMWGSKPTFLGRVIPVTYKVGAVNVTTGMVGLKNSHIHKNLTHNGEPQRYSWGTQKKKKKRVGDVGIQACFPWSSHTSDL